MKVSSWFIAGLVLSLGACRSPEPVESLEVEKASIRAVTEEFLNAHRARDWSRVAGIFTEDAVLMPPGAGIIGGRPAIQKWFEENEQKTSVDLEITEIDVRGDLAYVRGTSTVTVVSEGAELVTFAGKYLDIRRKQPDGSWLVSVDMFSPDIELPD